MTIVDRRLLPCRRAFIQAGFSGLVGLSTGRLFEARASAAPAGNGDSAKESRADAVILVFLTGGASHLDTLDPKPHAPAEVRGEFATIDTRVPGIQVCEHLPQLALRMDRLALVRSMAHGEPNHLPATHMALTGIKMPLVRSETDLGRVASRDDFPCYAAAMSYLHPRRDGVPSGVTLPTYLVEGALTWPGQNAGLLGARHDPWQIDRDPNKADFREETLALPEGLSATRVTVRQSLLAEVNAQREFLARAAAGRDLSDQQEVAFSLLTQRRVAQAFDIGKERAETRNRYGRHQFGQSLLTARRLVEVGVPVVQVNMGIVQTWDTHVANFAKLKDRLLPPLDAGVSALLDDLSDLGLLQRTLVVMAGEFGRTPRISTLPGATVPGRDHWPRVFSAAFAGAGIHAGKVIGKSDQIAALPVTRPYTLDDLGATVYQALGIERDSEIRDRLGRPMALNRGEPIAELFAG